MQSTYRVGLIVPSSNTTMETEVPEMLRRRGAVADEAFTFHSSRARLQNVSAEELAAMTREADRCALEVSDARVDAIAYACLIALVSGGVGYHVEAEDRISRIARENGGAAPVLSSAGALLAGIRALGAGTVAIVTPYVRPLTDSLVGYLEASGVGVSDAVSLEVPDNRRVAGLDPANLPGVVADRLDTRGAEAIVVSACVQMPSLPAIPIVEESTGLPVLSAATATAHGLLQALGLEPVVPDAGALLSGTSGPGRKTAARSADAAS